MEKYNSNVAVGISILMSIILWFMMFVIKPFNFWVEMSMSILVLIGIAWSYVNNQLKLRDLKFRHIVIGIFSAIGLYIIFYIGNIISAYLFTFKDAQISEVYSNRSQGNSILIGLLLLFIIGPGEEIYWRGFIQNILSKKFGENKGYICTTLLYCGVHITTGNFMLIIAALFCGIYWGWIYKEEKALFPVIISHALWDMGIFVLFPIQ